jgi:hypothetical protein
MADSHTSDSYPCGLYLRAVCWPETVHNVETTAGVFVSKDKDTKEVSHKLASVSRHGRLLATSILGAGSPVRLLQHAG